MHWKILKILSRTSKPKLIKLGTNYLWVKGIQVCSNKGPDSLQRGDNHKNIEMGLGHLKIFFRTMKLEKMNFTWKLYDLERKQVGWNLGLQGSDGANGY
jgi:hypothetical protein